ncbi:MAG TPA: ABC transporter permease [Patescibacteria group bacterium]|nr:ABC transporter permease [Patescibacteria group bacterium]
MSAVLRGNVRMALSGIRGSKWRSVLTMLGVIVGIVAVVTVVGIGEGVKRQVAGQLGHFGTDLITIRPADPAQQKSVKTLGETDAIFGMSSVSGLSGDDVDVVSHSNDVKLAVPLGKLSGTVTVDGADFSDVPVLSTSSGLPQVLNQKIEFGDIWSAENNALSAVIGKTVAARLFGENVPLGRSFVFRGQAFVVRGIFAEFAAVPFSPTANFDNSIFVPYRTAATITRNNAGFYAILAKPVTAGHLDNAAKVISDHLRQAHGGQRDFAVLDPQHTMDGGSDSVQLLTTWIFAVAAISLFIGGIGIMNIMLLTVTERMHEIGVRKAVGATSRQILGQFMIEAAVLSLFGGIIGVALSLAVDGLLYTYTDLRPVISWRAIAIATLVSLAIGIIFGTLPAVKAARKDPIEALRHE